MSDQPEARRKLGELISDFLGPAAKESGQLIAEQVRLFRWKAAIEVFRRAEAIADKKGIERKEIPYKFLVPFVEKASLEGEDSPLVGAWANLLVAASEKYDPSLITYTEILSTIGPNEAKILRNMWLRYSDNVFNAIIHQIFGLTEVRQITTERIADGSAFSNLDSNDVDEYGRLFVGYTHKHDKDGKPSYRIPKDMRSRRSQVRSLRFLGRHDLIKFYGVGVALGDGHTKFAHWAELTNLGSDFVSVCEGETAES